MKKETKSKKEKGVSEVIGTILMTFVIVMAVSVIGVNYLNINYKPTPKANVQITELENGSYEIQAIHMQNADKIYFVYENGSLINGKNITQVGEKSIIKNTNKFNVIAQKDLTSKTILTKR